MNEYRPLGNMSTPNIKIPSESHYFIPRQWVSKPESEQRKYMLPVMCRVTLLLK